MSTIITTPSHSESVPGAPRSRISIMLAAFWHTFRRDIMVTGREFMPFLMQVLVQPLSLLFIFGKVLPSVGAAQQVYPALFLPGVVGLNIALVGVQSITISLMLDLSSNREIDDRLLAPLPVSLVALEKIVFAAVRALLAGGFAFPLAYLILGSGYQVRTDALLPMIGIMILGALSSAALGLVIGTLLPADKIYLLFTLIFSVTLYTGCVYFSWDSLSAVRPLQIITLLNPLTYISEGLRYTMIPLQHGQPYATLPLGWVLLGIIGSFALFLFIGVRAFHKRVIS